MIDSETLRCRGGGAVYLALPGAPGDRIAGLLTVVLPTGITVGQTYRVIAHQLSGRHRRIEGTFELFIPVATTAVIIDRDVRRLSVLRHIFFGMAPT